MLKELECPYCKTMNEEPEEQHDQETTYFCECEKCNKIFGYTFYYLKSFTEFITPCQNEDELGKQQNHKWIKKRGFPKEYFEKKYYCEYCDEEKILSDEEIKNIEI